MINIILLICFLLLPIPINGESGLYNNWSGLIWCEPSSCVHEVGHKLDDLSNWQSKREEFESIVDELGWTHGDNYQEKYANIFSFANGKEKNIPEQLRKFYNWELAEKLMEKHNG